MQCSFCKCDITEDQLRGGKGKRCVLCTPGGAKPEITPEPAAPEIAVPNTISALNAMKKDKLVGLAGQLGSSTKGLKSELVARLTKKLKLKSLR